MRRWGRQRYGKGDRGASRVGEGEGVGKVPFVGTAWTSDRAFAWYVYRTITFLRGVAQLLTEHHDSLGSLRVVLDVRSITDLHCQCCGYVRSVCEYELFSGTTSHTCVKPRQDGNNMDRLVDCILGYGTVKQGKEAP